MRRTSAAVAVVALAALAVWLLLRGGGPGMFGVSPAPDPAEAPALDVQRYVASERFAQLTRDEQSAYLTDLLAQSPERLVALTRLDGLTDAEIARARRNLRRGFIGMIVGDARTCLALGEDERDAFIDARMDEMLAKHAAVEAEFRRTGGRDPRFGPPWGQGKPHPDEISRRIEEVLSETTPEERAILNAYRSKVMGRMIRRGMHDLFTRMRPAR